MDFSGGNFRSLHFMKQVFSKFINFKNGVIAYLSLLFYRALYANSNQSFDRISSSSRSSLTTPSSRNSQMTPLQTLQRTTLSLTHPLLENMEKALSSTFASKARRKSCSLEGVIQGSSLSLACEIDVCYSQALAHSSCARESVKKSLSLYSRRRRRRR